jgi:hypothetical protein
MMRFGPGSLLISAARGAVLAVCRERLGPGFDPVAVAELIVVELGVARSVAVCEDESIGGVALGVSRPLSLSDESHSGVWMVGVSSDVESCSFCCWSVSVPVSLVDPIAAAIGIFDSGVVSSSVRVISGRTWMVSHMYSGSAFSRSTKSGSYSRDSSKMTSLVDRTTFLLGTHMR